MVTLDVLAASRVVRFVVRRPALARRPERRTTPVERRICTTLVEPRTTNGERES
jgi:hypothetical protein